MKRSRFLITGGCGFIGSHLADALLGQGAGVSILDDLSYGSRANAPAGAELRVGDIRDGEFTAGLVRGCDGVFHLAAISSVTACTENWRESHTVNLTGSIGIFELAARGNVPVVYASSAAVYGAAEELPIAETAQPRPLSPYGADKYGAELHAGVGVATHGLRSWGLRFFNVFGPRQDPLSPYAGVITRFLDRIAKNLPLEVFGDGLQTRDFVHVSDVVAACIAAMDLVRRSREPVGEVCNVCTGKPTTVLDLARMLGEIAGRRAQIRHLADRAGDIRHSTGCTKKMALRLGIDAATGLRDGLTDLARTHNVQ